MELWGGHECTVNRIGDRYRDQTLLTGHEHRIDDIDRFAGLGITRLRYPVLWERTAPDSPDVFDWAWSDARIERIRRLGMRPIVGLVHHGSGPRYTNLISDDFAPLLARFASAVATRYPHVDEWTPVNEPLTTARFSALYGVWYPHARDEGLFWRALLNQIDGVRLSMRAIRRVNPAARLVQTEDLGHHYSTPALAGVADHLNHRRWMTWDLLTGRVGADHPLWSHLDRFGLGDRLRAIQDDPCRPDVIGVNHYITSERFLDDRLHEHPHPPPKTGYHDVTAARVLDPAPMGLSGLMRQAWDRYGLPLAVTESHLGCTREEQLRWLSQSWQACTALAAGGVQVEALTAWALLGSVDWNSLITQEAGHYEPGAYDVRCPEPRRTAIADLIARLAGEENGGSKEHPVLKGRGWWQRDIRIEHRTFPWPSPTAAMLPKSDGSRPIVITGATGTLGQALARACDIRGLRYVLTDRATLPIHDPDLVDAFLDLHRPWAVVNAAGWVRVDDAEREESACLRVNAEGAGNLARACAARNIHCTIFSSDLVFDGRKDGPYIETDEPSPLGAYGRSKVAAEQQALAASSGTLVIRTAAFFSPDDKHNFAVSVEEALREGRRHSAAGHVVSPTFVPDLVHACLDLIVDSEGGIWHLSSGDPVSWVAFGRRVAMALGLDPDLITPSDPAALGWLAMRPPQAVLASARGRMLPGLDDAISRHAAARREAWAREEAERPAQSRLAVAS